MAELRGSRPYGSGVLDPKEQGDRLMSKSCDRPELVL
jgi:hypothetical protein